MNFNEATLSQLPAMRVLHNLGWEYISRQHREGNSSFLLTDTLKEQLTNINGPQFKERDIEEAIRELRPNIKLDLKFAAWMFSGYNFRKQASRYSEGSGQRYVISKNLFEKLEVPVPKLHDQVKIDRVLDSAYEEISLFKAMLNNYELQRRGLIQELII